MHALKLAPRLLGCRRCLLRRLTALAIDQFVEYPHALADRVDIRLFPIEFRLQ